MLKPHRVIMDRFSTYADEAAAFRRRRRHQRKEFVRLRHVDGSEVDLGPEEPVAEPIVAAASRLAELCIAEKPARRGPAG